MLNQYYNIKKSKEDKRDIVYDNLIKVSEIKNNLPISINYIDELLPVRDQGFQGTCFAQSAACMKEWQELHDNNLKEYLSPQFFYNQRNYWNNGKNDGEDEKEDYGMTGRDVMRILLKIGICTEKEYPYGTIQYAEDISKDIFDSAAKYKIKGYARVDTLESLKISLVSNGPCLITVPVYSTKPDMWNKVKDSNDFLGGHAMTIIGYDNENEHFIIRNSWGKFWGDKGYCYFKYEDWGKHWECWTTTDIIDPDIKPIEDKEYEEENNDEEENYEEEENNDEEENNKEEENNDEEENNNEEENNDKEENYEEEEEDNNDCWKTIKSFFNTSKKKAV